MKRNIAKFLACVFLAASVVASLAWINNISIARQWYSDIDRGEFYYFTTKQVEITKDTGFDAERTKIFSGPLPWLNWTFVDVSTISTFIPFFGLVLITVGFFRIAMNTSGRKVSKYFPFFSSYDPVNVALGLIGTLWGIIMIGYYPQKDVDMSSLVLCLHTALYSTLVAVVWVFLVGYPIGYGMRWWYGQVSGLKFRQDQDADILRLFSELGAAASDASQGLRDAGTETRLLKSEISSTKTELVEVKTNLRELMKEGISSLKDARGIINSTLKNMDTEFKSWETAGKEMIKAVQGVERELEKEAKLRTKLEDKLVEAERQRDSAESRLRDARQALEG